MMSAASSSDSQRTSELPPGDLYVIGDIHGELGALERLVERLPLQPEDVVVQVGDCINRGPQSYEVVEFWLAFDRCERYVLGGNHEMMFYVYLCEANQEVLGLGVEATLRSYERHGWRPQPGDLGSVPESHLRFYTHGYPWTVSLLQTRDWLFTHAGYDLAKSPQEQSAEMLVWGSVVNADRSRTRQTVIRGHVPYPKVTFTRYGWVGVDTGCGMGGHLSCLRLSDRKVFTARPASYRPYWWRGLYG